MITLFKPNETDFSHNGLGSLDSHIIDPVVEEELNGLYKFTFKYPLFAPHGLEIEGQSILRVPVPEKEDQLFRVYRPVKSMGYVTVSCYHIFYDLADNFIEDTNIVEKNGQGAIQQLGGATQFGHRFRFFSDIQTVANARLVRKNVVASILDDEQANSFISRWGGELIRNNFDVRMNESAGTNAGFTVKHRKNLTGYEADVDYSTVITRIMPQGFDGLLLPESYIDSPLIDRYETPKIDKFDYNDVKAAIGEYANDEDAIPLQEAYTELRKLAQSEYTIHKVDIPTVQYKVDFVMLEHTEEYKDLEDLQKLKIGDMVTVDHDEDDFKVTAKLVRYKYNPISKRYLLAELGSIHEGLTTSFTNINKINRKVDELIEQTNIIQSSADGKSTIYRGGTEPSNPNLGDLWYKPNGNETEMYQFVDEGGQKYWKLIANTADVTQVKKDVDQAINDAVESKNTANQSVATANLASQNAVEAITQAQTAFDEAQTALATAEGFGSRITDAEDNISTLSQTSISFATRIENAEGSISTLTQTAQGLQNRVADAENNITSVTQLATGMQTRLTNAEGNINTLTQTATSFESRISSLRDDLDNLDIGGRNLVLNTGMESVWSRYNTNTSIELTNEGVKATWTGSNQGAMTSPITIDMVSRSEYTLSFEARGTIPRMGLYILTSPTPNSSFHGLLDDDTLSPTDFRKITVTFALTYNGSSINLFIGSISTAVAGQWMEVKKDSVKLEKGNMATDWTPAPEDLATQSQITQLSDNINLRVLKGETITQINIDGRNGNVLIEGRNVILDGDTTVTGTFRVKNANIESVDAGKMTTGILNAADVTIINLDANNINTGTINAIDIVGSSITSFNTANNDVITLDKGMIETFQGGDKTFEVNSSGLTAFSRSTGKEVGTFRSSVLTGSNQQTRGLDIMGWDDYLSIGRHTGDGLSRTQLAFYWNGDYDEALLYGGSGIRDSGMVTIRATHTGGAAGGRNPHLIIDNRTVDGTAYSGARFYVGRDNRRPNNDNFRSGFEVWQYKGDSAGGLHRLLNVDTNGSNKQFLDAWVDEFYISGRLRADTGFLSNDNSEIYGNLDMHGYNVVNVGDLTLSRIRTRSSPALHLDIYNTTLTAPGAGTFTGVAITRDASPGNGGIFMHGNRSYLMGGTDARFAILGVGSDSTSAIVHSITAYDRTYGSAANMYITGNGVIGRSTSARKYKILEEKIDYDYYKILDIPVKTWLDKRAYEEYADSLTNDVDYEDLYLGRITGIVAEDVIDAGLPQFVHYGSDGEVEGLQYDRLTTLLIPIVSDHEQKIKALEEKIETITTLYEQSIFKKARLESEMGRMRSRIQKLEAA